MSDTLRTMASSSFLPLASSSVFQLEADVEMILNRGLAAAGHDDDVLDAGMNGFFHAVLDEGLVHQRQHLFGLGFGGGRNRVPSPAAGNTALRTLEIINLIVKAQGTGFGLRIGRAEELHSFSSDDD